MGRKKTKINSLPKSKGLSQREPTFSFEGMGEVLLLFVMVFLGAVIYLNTLDNPFAFDDMRNIEDNASIRLSSFTWEGIKGAFCSKRPVAMLSFASNYYLHKENIVGYHLINILIHIITGIILYFFLKLTLIVSNQNRQTATDNSPTSTINFHTTSYRYSFVAFFAAFLWLVHPIQTQAVAYIVQRMTSMAAMFYLLSMLFYIKARLSKYTLRKYWLFAGCLISALLAFASKQIAATLPIFILLYEWVFFQNLSMVWLKRSAFWVLSVLVIFSVVASVYLGSSSLERILSDYENWDFTLGQRLLTEFRVLIYYLSLLLFPAPSRLNLDYDFPLSISLFDPITTLFSIAAISGLFVVACFRIKRHPLLSFCIIWFFGNLVIESSIIALDIVFEHRLYLPSMMFCLMAVVLIVQYTKPKWLIVSLLCLAIALLSFWSWERNKVWSNDITLWSDNVKKSPQKARPHYNLGRALSAQGRIDEAIEHYLTALKINPNFAKAHNNLGRALREKGQKINAIDQYVIALKINPNMASAHYNLGNALSDQGKQAEAIEHYLKALKIDHNYTEARVNLGVAFMRAGRPDDAAASFRKALRRRPDLVKAEYNLGAVLAAQGNLSEAIEHYLKALKINHNYKDAYLKLGSLFLKINRIDEAIENFQMALGLNSDCAEANNKLKRAFVLRNTIDSSINKIQKNLEIDPHNPDLYYNLGILYYRRGKLDKAIAHYQKALSLDPKSIRTLNNLAFLYMKQKKNDKAISLFKRIIELEPNRAVSYYNIACLYSIQNKVKKSIAWLKKAIDKGYNKWSLIKTNKYLDNIRESSYYKEILRDKQ